METMIWRTRLRGRAADAEGFAQSGHGGTRGAQPSILIEADNLDLFLARLRRAHRRAFAFNCVRHAARWLL